MDGSDLRLSDAERDAVVARLREAALEGRLEVAEFSQRLDVALHARTHGDVAALTADLPAPASPARKRGLAHHLRRYAETVGPLWAIWGVVAATGGGLQGLWPLWVSLPLAIFRVI